MGIYGRESLLTCTLGLLLMTNLASPVQAGTLERIQDEQSINVGYRSDAYPFSFKDDAGQPAGYTIDICRHIIGRIAAELNLERVDINYVEVTPGSRFDDIGSGKVDLLCGSTTKRLSLRQQVAFSLPIFRTGISAVMRHDADSALQEVLVDMQPLTLPRQANAGHFDNLRFGARADTTAEVWLRDAVSTIGIQATIKPVESYTAGVDDVIHGDVDAFFGDRAILLSLMAKDYESSDIAVGTRRFSHEPYALAVGKGENPFLLMVDRQLIRLFMSPVMSEIYETYFGDVNETVRTEFLMSTLPE
ncbi:MAG: hypothetical protein COA62_08290 [Rhodobiaceae bacterium]|nr:MAG: hypothetical protein COA62_08290 [Rhodobiaceae bacterium]